jgi:type IV secretion system protein VirB9
MNRAWILGVSIGACLAHAQQQPMPNAAAYQQAANILQGDPGQPVSAEPTKPTRKGRSVPQIQGTINGGSLEVERQAPLPANARLALALSEGWLNSGPPPSTGPDGRVLYVYGQGVPTVVCAVLQVCELDLEAGEIPKKDALDWGDHRFEVSTRTAGNGAGEFTYLVLKPTEPHLDTTMTIGTNKRPYYVRLVSTSHDHMARVGFSYPGEAEEKKKAEADAKKAETDREQTEAARLAALSTAKPIRNWKYRVKLHGKDAAYLRPERIGDDGIHTYIVLSEETRHRGLPVVELKDARGAIPANARWDGNELVVDALFEHACLLEGVGRAQQRACITNEGLIPGRASHGSRN